MLGIACGADLSQNSAVLRAFFRRLRERLRLLWKRARSEHATPKQIGLAVAVGVFAGCTPAVGVHGPLALGLATAFKLNRLWAWLGSRVSNFITLPFVVYAEVQLAHRVRSGAYLDITRQAIEVRMRDDAMGLIASLLLDWMLGMIPVGGGLALVFGLLSFAVFWLRERRKNAKLGAVEELE